MKILVVSDTHGYNDKMYEVIEKESPFDVMLHLGDIEGEQERLRDRVDCTLHIIAGNNDYDLDLERIKVIDLCGHRAVLTHGHRYQLYAGYDPLYYLAAENQAELVFFGHTHVPVVHEEGAVTLVNPGSLTYPRQHGRQSTYIVGDVQTGKKPVFEIRYI